MAYLLYEEAMSVDICILLTGKTKKQTMCYVEFVSFYLS